MAEEKVVLYWLDESRATRILWLLELLKIPYELRVYKRDSGFRAPADLKKVHPLGRSPILKIGDKILVESGLICDYVLSHYDTGHLLVPTDPDEKLEVEYYLHYVEGTLQQYLTSLVVLDKAREKVPWMLQSVGNKVIDGLMDKHYKPELYHNLEYLESKLTDSQQYFVGNKLTAADIMLSYPLTTVFEHQEHFNFDLEKYPRLKLWCLKIQAEPSYVKTVEVISKKG